jgi:hypothetical protein
MLTVEVLAEIEELLRKALNRDASFVLGDYFDYIAGTSTGAIVATFNRDPRQAAGDALTFTPLTTEPGYEGMPAWSPDGQTIAYVAEVNSTLQVFTRQRPASVSDFSSRDDSERWARA